MKTEKEKITLRRKYVKKYRNKPTSKLKKKAYDKKYYIKPGVKVRAKTYYQRYNQKPEVKVIKKERMKARRKEDRNFLITMRLRNSFHNCFQRHIKGVIKQESIKYGIIWTEIIKSLEPFPEDLSNYHIDHIKPLCSFTFVKGDGTLDLIEIKKAWSPENLQWLTAKENMSKGKKW